MQSTKGRRRQVRSVATLRVEGRWGFEGRQGVLDKKNQKEVIWQVTADAIQLTVLIHNLSFTE